jgi:hypothetical protein
MKRRLALCFVAMLCLALLFSFSPQSIQAQVKAKPAVQKITVLSPMGKPPSIQIKPLAPRLDTLDGKTVYLVNDGYLSTDILLGEMQAWFKANMPKVNTVYRLKGGGGFTAEDPQLWAEIKQKADAVIMGMGH